MAYVDISYSLISAVCEGNLERAKELITSFGLSYSQTWSEGYVLLCDAIENRHTEIIKLLLTNGCKVNSDIDKSYNTPLHFAVINGDIEIVKMLLDRRANVYATTRYGTTSLHYALEHKKVEIVELLLNHGANVNARDNAGITPLYLAVHHGYVDNVKMLLDRGANINTISDNTHTYSLFDEHFYCTQIAHILKQHIVKMRTANLYVSEHLSESCLDTINLPELQDLQYECEKEVAIMKNEKISNTNISFYDILIKDIYMKNENVVQVLRSDEYKTKFPIYSSMINNYFRKYIERKELLEQGTKLFYFFCNFPELPLECIEQIFSYLSDNDVRILINTYKSVSISNLNTDITDIYMM
ncbi:ankyrin-1-like [Pseudomyrmex gracilis]|uniref:ankyrin-1-like n=1 Tax=Pseudomyrmex gracilis TaxID=219809 RepID=UPI000994DD08|nr:ankyrin-1-like [Pseudomyrmex gracilis]